MLGLAIAISAFAAAGARLVSLERAAAESGALARLEGLARDGAGRLVAAASRLVTAAAAGEAAAIAGADGRFVLPAEPVVPRSIAPPRDADPEGDFYLAEADRAESGEGDLERARGLYRAAAGPARDPRCRAAALFRLAALERRAGRDAEADARLAEFLDLAGADARFTLEGLFARARIARAEDGALRDDLLSLLGSGDDAVALGLLETAGLADSDAVLRRRADLARLDEWRSLMADARSARTGARLRGDRLLAFSVDADGRVLFASGEVPPLPAGVEILGASAAAPERLTALATAGEPLDGVPVVASVSRLEVDAAARSRSRLVAIALALLFAGTGGALLLLLRAVRREAAAARERAAFVAQVGHDLRTPLARIRLFAETLADGRVTDPAEAREFAGVAAREAARLSGVVEKVLDFSRFAAGARPLARTRLDLRDLARGVAEAHRPLFERAAVRLENDVDGGAPLPVDADADALGGAIGNLLENALRHAAAGGEVTIAARAEDGGRASVRVLDRGPGLPAGLGERIFERFVQGPSPRPSGVGLGLALVREVAEAHGGRAAAESRPGGGAIFSIVLPLAERGSTGPRREEA